MHSQTNDRPRMEGRCLLHSSGWNGWADGGAPLGFSRLCRRCNRRGCSPARLLTRPIRPLRLPSSPLIRGPKTAPMQLRDGCLPAELIPALHVINAPNKSFSSTQYGFWRRTIAKRHRKRSARKRVSVITRNKKRRRKRRASRGFKVTRPRSWAAWAAGLI